MAHLCTYAADGKTIRNVMGHYDRWGGDLEKAAKREQIDPKLTCLNYNLAPDRGMPLDRYCERRIDYYSDLGAKLNDSSRPVCDIALTMPKALDAELAPQFFVAGYKGLLEAIGGNEGDVVCAYVHLDEPGAQPHMHFCFIQASSKPKMTNDKSRPLKWTKADEARNKDHKAGTLKTDKKGTVKYKRVPVLDADGNPVMSWSLSPSAVWTKAKLKTFHVDLDKAVGAALGMPDGCGIRLDADDGRKKLSKLDHDEFKAVTKAKADMEAEAALARQAADKAQQDKALSEARLEGVRQAEQAGPVELGRAARDGGAAEDKRAEEAAGEALDREVEQLERRVREAEQRRAVLAGRCRVLRAGFEAAKQRLAGIAGQIIAELPHLGSAVKVGHKIGVIATAAAKRFGGAACRCCGVFTAVWPMASSNDEAYVSYAVDGDCKVWQRLLPDPRLELDPTGVDARTGLTDEQAAQASAERVAARKAERSAAKAAAQDAADAKALPARQAAQLADRLARNDAQWRGAMKMLGYASHPAKGGRYAIVAKAAEMPPALVYPGFDSNRYGNVLRSAGKPFGRACEDVARAVGARVDGGMTKEQAMAEVLGLARRCCSPSGMGASYVDRPSCAEDMEWLVGMGFIDEEAAAFAREVKGWDYWQTPEKQNANRIQRQKARRASFDAELAKKVASGSSLSVVEKREMTPKQRKQWEAAKAANQAAHRGFHGSTGTPSASGGGASHGYRSRGR